jgi:mono/diheme cytochrome c family protein
VERAFARDWRKALTQIDFAAMVKTVMGKLGPWRKPKSLEDAKHEAQAKRGETQFGKSCAPCHGPDLAGLDTAPSLTGSDFNNGWNDLSLDDLFERIRTTMPADGPGSLERQQYVDVLAYILSKDNFPAGQTELPPENPALKLIKFVSKKPAI